VLDSPLKLHPSVALRPEPFGALAYHYDNRRLIFLKHPTIVDVVKDLEQHPDLQSTLSAHGIDEQQWDNYDKAICSLIESDVVVAR
jgi:putative mycofactocin binding protein MftB|tara:strand:+ start:430 stop:687 length:258 start_codon:yes stop_codon:yes gene_type:complete